MAVNKTLAFVARTPEHPDDCAICGRRPVGRRAVAASFTPEDPPDYAAVYCDTCIDQLAAAKAKRT